MRESGVDWIGTFPADWVTCKNKYLFDIVKRIAGKEGYDVLSVTQQGLRVKDIDSGEGQLAKDYSGYQLVYPGDFVMNHMDLLTGWVDCSSASGVTSPDYRVFKPKKSERIDRHFFKYVFQYCYSNKVFYNLGSGVAGFGRWRLQAPAFNNFEMPLPSYPEQQRIADYLDESCAAIDEVRRTIEGEIKALRRLRKATIHKAVTKGLDGDVPMKDSGVEWIGEIPEHWKIISYKYIASVVACLRDPRDYPDYPQVSPDCIEKDTGKLLGYSTVEEAGIISDNHLFHTGQIVYSKVRPALNKLIIAPFDGMCSADMYPIKTPQNTRWLHYYMLSNAFMDQIIVSAGRVKMPKVNKEELGRFVVVKPPLPEQQRIADYLDERCAAIDAIINTRTKQLERLDVYRKALVFSYVTGKREVPDGHN